MSDKVKITPEKPDAAPISAEANPQSDTTMTGNETTHSENTNPAGRPEPNTEVLPATGAAQSSGATATKPGMFKKKPALKGKKKKRKKKIIIAVVIALVVLALIAWGVSKLQSVGQPSHDPEAIYRGDVSQVTKDDVIKTTTLKGTLQSAQSVALFSNVNAKVQSVGVKAGDRVQVGQRLAQLDSTQLRQELASQQASLQDAQITKNNAIAEAQETYNNFSQALASGTNPDIMAAQKGVKAAESEYTKARNTLTEMAQAKRDGTLQSILEQDQALRQAYQELENTKLDRSRIAAALREADTLRSTEQMKLEGDRADLASKRGLLGRIQEQLKTVTDPNAKNDLEKQFAEISADVMGLQADVEQREASVGSAKDSYESTYSEAKAAELKLQQVKENLGLARRQARLALKKIDAQLADAREAVNKAQDGIAEAKVSLQQAQIRANQQNNANARALNQARLAGKDAESQQAIAKIRADINSATVTSPINGIVTSVNAKVGSAPEGALVVVEDDHNMMISTSVKEKDVAKIQVGNEVTFTTPATGDKEFTGVITFISPAAASAAPPNPEAGGISSPSSGDTAATFPVQIKVTGDLSGLRLGSSVKAKAITDSQRGALTVPSSAIVDSPSFVPDDKAGDDVEWPKSILVVEGADGNKPKIRELKVKVLADASGVTAISGDGVKEGLNVLSNATDYVQLVGKKSAHFVDIPVNGEMEQAGGTGY